MTVCSLAGPNVPLTGKRTRPEAGVRDPRIQARLQCADSGAGSTTAKCWLSLRGSGGDQGQGDDEGGEDAYTGNPFEWRM